MELVGLVQLRLRRMTLLLAPLVTLALAVTIAHRWQAHRLLAGHPPVRDLHPYEIAYLTGGGRHAVAAALLTLRLDGAVAAGPGGRLTAVADPRAATTPLDLAAHHAVRRAAATVARVTADPGVRRALEGLREGLVQQGVVASPSATRALRVTAYAFYGVVGASFFVAVSSAGDGGGVREFLPLGVAVSLVLLFGFLGGRTRHRTRAGDRALEHARSRHSHLDPRLAPSYPTYGLGAAAMGTALFGTAALMAVDPDFTRCAGLGRLLEMAGPDSSSGGIGYSGSSCSSGAPVCSSGGGGSGCGGGSSCGGGGGGSGCGGGGSSS
ncbi:TIGR04222 domain-containing membrane protein [Actinomadura kijaniata]|uniref:TIGR04222 domain-containing membrane protein n=1 Tax=Actinomadura kijaniata TaxID=46161 RepID=UPI003F1D62DD